MNRYPLWKNVLIGLIIAFGLLYALPNLFGETPAVLVSSGKATVKVTPAVQKQAEEALTKAGLAGTNVQVDPNGLKFRFKSEADQFKGLTAIKTSLNPDKDNESFVVAFGLLSATPTALTNIFARPMYLGLDLRGGVHFLMQVDMKAAISKRIDTLVTDVRTNLRDKKIRATTSRIGDTIEVKFGDEATRTAGRLIIADSIPDLDLALIKDGEDLKIVGKIKPDALLKTQESVLAQNISTINKRVNELGVAEPVVQQQGVDRVVVQLPGVQNPDVAKKVLGRTATLELRMVCDSAQEQAELRDGTIPVGCERFANRDGQPLALKREVVFTGDNLTGASAGFDSQSQEPTVNLTLDAKGARIFRDVTRENINRRMAIILIEKGKGEVITAPVIRSEIPNGQVQISGAMKSDEAAETALLLRAGALAAPMEIIEERTIGPSLGAENIKKGFNSTIYGFIAIAIFMCFYYTLFGFFSTIALAINVLLLIALLSLLQATLTLPGFAAIALTLGMAIDANVLINERIREELRAGKAPQAAIAEGYDRAWATILDSNVTTLIAGLALLAFGSGAIRGFAVVHCLGILTSMVSAVFVSRGLVNLWYGGKKRLDSIAIGTVWKPDASDNVGTQVSTPVTSPVAKP
jgi:preprotein translocase subunit SecD